MIAAISQAQRKLCVCLYPVAQCSDGFWLATDSGGNSRYLVAILDDESLYIHKFTRGEISKWKQSEFAHLF